MGATHLYRQKPVTIADLLNRGVYMLYEGVSRCLYASVATFLQLADHLDH
jgi:hypothetical protein